MNMREPELPKQINLVRLQMRARETVSMTKYTNYSPSEENHLIEKIHSAIRAIWISS